MTFLVQKVSAIQEEITEINKTNIHQITFHYRFNPLLLLSTKQLKHMTTKTIEMDYIVKADKNVVHVLNAVSPGWTSSIPFAHWVVENQPLLA